MVREIKGPWEPAHSCHCKKTIKASYTLEHQPTIWPVPYACAHAAISSGQGQPWTRVIWLCACVRYWPDRGLMFECVTCFYCSFNFHSACYYWSSEPKGKEKNDFDNIVMGYWYFFMHEGYDSVS